MNEPDVMVYLMSGIFRQWKDRIFKIYIEAGLFSDRWKNIAHSLRRWRR